MYVNMSGASVFVCTSAFRVKRSGVQSHVPLLLKMLCLETPATHTHRYSQSVTKPGDDVRLQYKPTQEGGKRRRKIAGQEKKMEWTVGASREKERECYCKAGVVLAVCVGT